MGLIGRGTVHMAGVPTSTTVGNGPADHAYEVATSTEGPASRGGRSRPIVRQAPFHRVPVCEKELNGIKRKTPHQTETREPTENTTSTTLHRNHVGTLPAHRTTLNLVQARQPSDVAPRM